MNRFFYCLLFLFTTPFVSAQKLKKSDKIIVANLQTHIKYLADDQLEGRRTGSNGEKLAYEYISNEFSKAGLLAKGDNATYLQAFEVNDGKMVTSGSHLIINGNDLAIDKEYFPLSFSCNSALSAVGSIALQENGSPWFYDIKDLLEANKDNPHFDLTEVIKTKATDAANKSATVFFIYNSSDIKDELQFDPKVKSALSVIPVIYVTKIAKEKYLKDETASLDIQLKTEIVDKTIRA